MFVHCKLLHSNYILYPMKSVGVRKKRPSRLNSGRSLASTFYLAITNSYLEYLPRDFKCIQVRNVITYAVMLTVHIQEFCQVSPGPLPRSACGPGNEASAVVG